MTLAVRFGNGFAPRLTQVRAATPKMPGFTPQSHKIKVKMSVSRVSDTAGILAAVNKTLVPEGLLDG